MAASIFLFGLLQSCKGCLLQLLKSLCFFGSTTAFHFFMGTRSCLMALTILSRWAVKSRSLESCVSTGFYSLALSLKRIA